MSMKDRNGMALINQLISSVFAFKRPKNKFQNELGEEETRSGSTSYVPDIEKAEEWNFN